MENGKFDLVARNNRARIMRASLIHLLHVRFRTIPGKEGIYRIIIRNQTSGRFALGTKGMRRAPESIIVKVLGWWPTIPSSRKVAIPLSKWSVKF